MVFHQRFENHRDVCECVSVRESGDGGEHCMSITLEIAVQELIFIDCI